MISLEWLGQMAFRAIPESGNRMTFDADPESGGQNLGPTPLEGLLGSVAACSAMDVVYVLRLKKQHVDSYRVEIKGERNHEGPYPRPFTAITIRHILAGKIDEAILADAVKESDARYCSAIATLRAGPRIESQWQIETEGNG